jgi:hypothetical protein
VMTRGSNQLAEVFPERKCRDANANCASQMRSFKWGVKAVDGALRGLNSFKL